MSQRFALTLDVIVADDVEPSSIPAAFVAALSGVLADWPRVYDVKARPVVPLDESEAS